MTTIIDKDFINQITLMQEKELLPKGLLSFIEEIHITQLKAIETLPTIAYPQKDIQTLDKILQGVPLLALDKFPYDLEHATTLFLQLLTIMKKQDDVNMQTAAENILSAYEEKKIILKDIFDAFLRNDENFLQDMDNNTPEAPRTIHFLALCALYPALQATAKKAFETLALPEDHVFIHGTCPVCGSLPYINELRHTSAEGARIAHCGICRTDYRIQRLICIFCNNDDPETLQNFTHDSLPDYRVQACDKCNFYIKIMDFKASGKTSVPPLADLESLVLDHALADKKYKRATWSVWGF